MNSKKDENQMQIEEMSLNETEVKKDENEENEKVKNIVKKPKKVVK